MVKKTHKKHKKPISNEQFRKPDTSMKIQDVFTDILIAAASLKSRTEELVRRFESIDATLSKPIKKKYRP